MKKYLILRPCLWFAKGDKVTHQKFCKYYTEKALQDLIDCDYVREVE